MKSKALKVFVSILIGILMFIIFNTIVFAIFDNATIQIILFISSFFIAYKLSSIITNKSLKGVEDHEKAVNDSILKRPRKINPVLKNIYTEFISIDTETTGLDANNDKIIEIAALKYKNGAQIKSLNYLINPKTKIPNKITNITGITNEMVKNCPDIEDILDELLIFIDNLPIVAHNVMFDVRFIRNVCREYCKDNDYWIDNPLIDTVKLSRKMFPELPNHKLGTVIEHIGINTENRHRATDDAIAVAEIYLKYCEYYNKKQEEKKNEFTKDELKCYELVKDILIKNKRNINYLRYMKTGKYIDIQNFYSFFRIKFNGNKRYIISDLTKEDLRDYAKDFELEDAPKSETGKTRIMISSPDDLTKVIDLILYSFDKSMESVNYYREHVDSAEKNIKEYLSTI